MTKLKEISKKSNSTVREIIAEATANVSKVVAASLPKSSELRRIVNRQRHNPEMPKNPKTLSELNLTAEFCRTLRGENFLLYDSGPDENKRIVMFGTNANLNFLVDCTELYMDGTFSITPPLFNQLYTIHGNWTILQTN